MRNVAAGGVPVRAGAYLFSGSSSGLVVKSPVTMTQQMAVAVRFKTMPGQGGYLFAKTSARGMIKHLGIYVSAKKQDVAVYFSKNNAPSVVRFKVDVSDGKEYRMVVSIDNGQLVLLVDDVRIYSTKEEFSQGVLTDCDQKSTDCVVHVGDRVSALKL